MAVSVLFERLHLLAQLLLLSLCFLLRIVLKLLVDLAPVPRIAWLVRLLVPAGYVALDEPEPYLARLALDLGAVCLELSELVGDLNLAENGGEEGVGNVAYVFQHVDVLDQPGFGQGKEARDWHCGAECRPLGRRQEGSRGAFLYASGAFADCLCSSAGRGRDWGRPAATGGRSGCFLNAGGGGVRRCSEERKKEQTPGLNG